ncbi:hypothetical protein CW304_24430 [Bacillus sp. UFRGS-B20]|nr:hypothetical protein CW304_24430 [Bacillus sp. UFRGS-B20]
MVDSTTDSTLLNQIQYYKIDEDGKSGKVASFIIMTWMTMDIYKKRMRVAELFRTYSCSRRSVELCPITGGQQG